MNEFMRAFLLVKNQWGRRILTLLGVVLDTFIT